MVTLPRVDDTLLMCELLICPAHHSFPDFGLFHPSLGGSAMEGHLGNV